MTPGYLRERFFHGLSLEDADGKPVPEHTLADAIAQSKRWFTRVHGVLFTRSRVVLGNLESKDVPNTPKHRTNLPGIDYDQRSWVADRWVSLKLPLGPVCEVHHVELGLGGVAQPGVVRFNKDWFQLEPRRYYLRLFPGFSSLKTVALSSFHMNVLASQRRIPHAWRLVYTGGFAEDSYTVTSATNTTPITITIQDPGHQLETGDTITVKGVTGNTAANGKHSVTVIDAQAFQLDGVEGNGEYQGGGHVAFSETQKLEPDLAHAIGLRATITLLPSIAMLQNGDLTSESVGVDGLSQSRNYAVSAQSHRLSPYQHSLQEQLDSFLRSYFVTDCARPPFFHPLAPTWRSPNVMAYEVKARIIGYADYETANLSNGDHVFRRGVTDAIYVDQDADVVLHVAGRSEVWRLARGVTELQASAVIQAGTEVGVMIRGLYRRVQG